MLIWIILLGSVAVLGGIIAYAGDVVGRKIGRKHLRLFGLRPKTTGLLVAVASGVAVALLTVGTVALLARNTLDNAIRAQEIRADLEDAKRQLLAVNREYAKAKSDLETADSARTRLEDQLAGSRAQLAAKQGELARTVELYGRLKESAQKLEAQNKTSSAQLAASNASLAASDARLQASDAKLEDSRRNVAERDGAVRRLEAQRVALSGKIADLGRKRLELSKRIDALTTEKLNFEKRYEATQKRLADTQARLSNLEGQVREFEASRAAALEGDIEGLTQVKANLESANADLREQNADLERDIATLDENLKETRSALSLASQGEFIYRRNELIMQAIVPQAPPETVRSKLQSVVRQASLIVQTRGASRDKPLTLLPNDNIEPYVAQITRTGGPDLVMVRATRNLTRGIQVSVLLDIRPNRTLYLASQPIRTLELPLGTQTAPRPPAEVLSRLQGLLRDVRNDLRTKNVPLENITPPDVIPDEEVLEFVDKLRPMSGTVLVAVVGRQDVLPSGPLRFSFSIVK